MSEPSSAPWTLRRATPADAPHVAAYMADPAVFAGTLQLPYPDEEVWRTRLASQPGLSLQLVAEVEGQVVATAGLFTAAPSPRRRHALGLGITVAQPWQGQGVGRALMAALCEWADRWAGILRIELTVFADNQRAIALYQAFGFEIEGRLRAYALRDGHYADVLTMSRLHPNPPTRLA